MDSGFAERLQVGYDAFNRGDFSGWLDMLSPDVEFRESFLSPDESIYRGHEGVRQWLASGGEGLTDVRFQVHDVFERGADTAIVDVEVTARGTTSGAPVTARLAHRLKLGPDGKVVLFAAYPSVHHAEVSDSG